MIAERAGVKWCPVGQSRLRPGLRLVFEDVLTHQIDHRITWGCAELEDTGRGWLPHRLPSPLRAQCDDPQLQAAESQPSGVRLVFESAATVVEVDAVRTRTTLTGVPDRPDGKVDLIVDDVLMQRVSTSGGDVVRVDLATGATTHEGGPVQTIRFDGLAGSDKRIEIWLPHHERVELVALRTDAPIDAVEHDRARWVHHGSSISQGSNADGPSTTWPALVAARARVELVNLGLAGSAMLDPFTARAIRDQPADLLSVKIGINLVNADLMRRRAFAPAVHGFLDTIRDGHPGTPLVVIGPLYCPIHENTPGPGAFDPEALANGRVKFVATGVPDAPAIARSGQGRLTLSVIRSLLAAVIEQRRADDPLLSFVDGHVLYGPDDAVTHPLPDGLHPDGETHRLIADRATPYLVGALANR